MFSLQTVTNSSYQRVERVQKVEQVVTSKQFVQSGQSFIVETGDPDADAVSFIVSYEKRLHLGKTENQLRVGMSNELSSIPF